MTNTNSRASAVQMTLWSAVAVLFFNVVSSGLMISSWFVTPAMEWNGIEAYAASFSSFQMLSMLPGIFVAIGFVPLCVGAHTLATTEMRHWTLVGVMFATICACMLSYQYYTQMTTVRQSIEAGSIHGLELFVVGNVNSFWWSLETLGYGFMGLATLFLIPAFPGGGRRRLIRYLLGANGVLGVAGLISYPLVAGLPAILIGLSAWVVVFPFMLLLIALEARGISPD